MMLIYPVGIPLWYIYLLWPHRQELNKKRPQDQEELETRQTENSWQGAKQVSDLWEPYKPGRWYYEVRAGVTSSSRRLFPLLRPVPWVEGSGLSPTHNMRTS